MAVLMTMLLLPLLFAAVNYFRGRGKLPAVSKVLSAIMWAWITGIAAAVLGINEAPVMLITFLGTLCWIVPGWGLYFSSFTGVWKEGEAEIRFIDHIGLRMVPYHGALDESGNRKRGTICMALRGFIFSAPLFIGLAGWFSAWIIVLFWPLMLWQGPIYYANKPFHGKYGNIMPEVVTGWLLGFLVIISLIIGGTNG
jgi:hypothetical protein